jgi:hypothetical protein
MNNDAILGIAIGSLCGLALLSGLALLIIGTILKTRFGVNFRGADCAECGTPAPVVRAPKDLYEMLWGGWTCEECGQANDKWGNARD